jgi:transposase-like protein
MEGKRRRLTAEEKVRVLKRHLVDKVAVSAVCEEAGIAPAQFYQWQKQLFENGAAAFERSGPKPRPKEWERVQKLEAKLQRKDAVLAELMEEHVALKKSLGEL